MRDIGEFPLADPGRESDVVRMFPLHMSPEEYAARHAHDWFCFSFDDYRYRDARLEKWIHRLGDILFSREGAPSLEEVRARYLSEDERRAIEARSREDL